MFATATPFDTPRLMAELVSWMDAQEEAKALHPLLIIATFIVGVSRDPSVPGRQWPSFARADDLAASPGWLCLRPV